MTDTSVMLKMRYHQKSGRYLIYLVPTSVDTDNRVHFPPDDRIYEIWEQTLPGFHFFIGNVLEGPAGGFYADVGSGTKPSKRQQFCNKLAAECRPVTQEE